MGQNFIPSTARVGLNLDATISQIQQGELSYALNAIIAGFDGRAVTYQNEQSNELCSTIPTGYKVICAHPIIEKSIIVFWSANPDTNGSEIGVLDIRNCVYSTKINQACLNFSIRYPIKKAVHKITACGTEVYWTDALNPRRYVDLDNLPFIETIDGCVTNESSTEIDCNRLLIQPNFLIPQISYEKIDSEGELTAGSYQFAIQYANSIGDPYTSYYSITNPIPIADPLKVTLDFNYTTGKAIELLVSNLDTSGTFLYYNLAVIKTINNITSFELVGTFQIERSTDQVIYTGQSKTDIRLSADDIFERFITYEKAADVTAVQDILIWSGLTTNERISFQKIANQISTSWETYRLPPGSGQYKSSVLAATTRGYFRDEVYGFELVPLFTDGTQADGFHIPGRIAMDTDLELVFNTDIVTSTLQCDPPAAALPRWKVYNTGSVKGTVEGPLDVCYEGPYQHGEMAYWESEEVYPCNTEVWGELAGKNIRHHKFPDNSITNHFDRDGNIYPIGIKFDLDQIWSLFTGSLDLTVEQKAKIAGFKIIRTNRANNKSVVAKGILYNVGQYTKDSNTYFYPNYPYNDLRPDPFISITSNRNIQTVVSTHSEPSTSVGNTPTLLDSSTATVADIVKGAKFRYTGIFNGATNGNRQLIIRSGLNGDTSYNGPVVYDSGIFQAGHDTEWTLTIDTIYDTSNGGAFWNTNVTGTLILFGSQNKEIVKHSVFTVPNHADIVLTINLFGIGEQDGDIELTQSQLRSSVITNTSPETEVTSGFTDEGSKQRFTFHSPDTSFFQPNLGDNLKLDSVIWGQMRAHFAEVRNHAKYKFPSLESFIASLAVGAVVGFASGLYGTSDQPFDGAAMFTTVSFLNDIIYKLIPKKNFAYQYNSVGDYTEYIPIPNDQGNKIRFLDIASYIIPGYQGVGDTYLINNWKRESSVYLRTTRTLPYPSDPTVYSAAPLDESRITMSQAGTCNTPSTEITSLISAYYGAIKRPLINQYGQIYSYNTVDTGAEFMVGDIGTRTVFGGDCYINKFTLKRKLPFFIDDRVGQPDESDVFYDTLGNVGYPTYWFSTDIQQGDNGNFSIGQLFGVKVNHFDCANNDFFYDAGKIYLYAYGIPNFFCESEVNVDYRQAYNAREGEYYPHVSQGIPDDWLQEINVPINNDNTYVYNKSYSKQNIESTFNHLPVDFLPNEICLETFPNRSIYSDRQFDVVNYKRNNWRLYRPASVYDFPLNYGRLISLEGVENRAIIARFENKSQIYNALLTIDTSVAKAAYIGNSNLFTGAPPIDYKETDIGYNGTQHKFFLRTEFGNISVDAKRGNVYLLDGAQAHDLTSKEANMFFSDNLPFQMFRYFPTYDVDNVWKGVGISGVYESKYKRFILTKLDYKPLYSTITYDSSTDTFFYQGQIVELTDTNYFCNVSFTISYSFLSGTWSSFHSYLPNYYVANADFFFSGMNNGFSVWRHNTNITTYNSYYGVTAPYVIEYPISYKTEDEILQSVRDYSKIIRQIDEKSFVELNDSYFDKVTVYNDQQTTGIINLVFKQTGNMIQSLQYPRYNSTSVDILFTKSNNCYQFHTLWDVTADQDEPLFIKSCTSLSVDKVVNQSNMNYTNQSYRKAPMQAKDSKIRLTLDSRSDIRIVSEFIIEETQTSIK